MVAKHGLTPKEYEYILQVLGRVPSITELGVFSVMWSEHCSYKHTRHLLKTLPTKGPHVLHGPGENAGAIDLGDDIACVFKIESHNHPSAVEPSEGAATGVGGILRDVFAMGARPVALLDALRFGPPGQDKNSWIIGGVIAGIAHYGNCVGVPTVGGEFSIDPCYSDNCLVNVMAVGLAPAKKLMTAQAKEAGHLLVYYGNATGRDGVHGATFASTGLSDETAADRSCVQVGDPFMEKKIMEATLELVEAGVLEALQDMGAAGLTCSSTEMGDKGGLGILLDLDAVPQRAAKLSAYEILLSESQERMLAVVAPDNMQYVEAILNRWDLEAVVVGVTTDTGRFQVDFHGAREVDVPLAPICRDLPKPDLVEPKPSPAVFRDWRDVRPPDDAWPSLLLTALGSPHFASKKWIYEQYDHQVQTNTVVAPGGGAAVIRIRGSKRLLAMTTDGNGLWCALDPREGAKMVVAEAARNLVAVGAQPMATTNNLNFGNPRKPEVAWQFAEAIAGMGEACRAFMAPITGGNVSLYNESSRSAVYPTPVIGMVGLIEDHTDVRRGVFKNAGDAVFVVGPAPTHAGGSKILRDRAGRLVGPAPKVDLTIETRVQATMLRLIRGGVVSACTDVSEGGLLMALCDMLLPSPENFGCHLVLPRGHDPVVDLLSEEASRFVFTASAAEATDVAELIASAGVPLVALGEVTTNGLFTIEGVMNLSRSEMQKAWETGL